jgi:hypothetical protein
MLTSFIVVCERLKTIYIGNLVQRPESQGNRRFVSPLRTKLLPLDWSPTTISLVRVSWIDLNI